ncbi:MAG: glycogen/starch synthase [Candidatus Polarisedimenticolia bacterium]|nr:glycogen synthase [bacterium]
MHIAHIAPEMTPFAKTGGLGDVVGALPAAQAAAGDQVTVVVPGYGFVRRALGLAAGSGRLIGARIDGTDWNGELHSFEHRGVRVLLPTRDDLFDRPEIYGGPEGGYADNGVRFGWFCAAALNALRESAPAPDVVVAHDWPAAPAVLMLRAARRADDVLGETASALVVHNLAHQGIFGGELAARLGLDRLDPEAFAADGAVNLLKGAIRGATVVVTVSPTYAREIVTPEYGEGLADDIAARAGDVVGILNGLDVALWDPSSDPRLPHHFDAADFAGKARCKESLQRELGLEVDPSRPLFALVSRVDRQKGIDLVAAAAPWLLDEGAQFAMLGSGQKRYLDPLVRLAALRPREAAVATRFDEPLAHRIYAGADFFLMPSRFEPCGLGQMAALRYGALPIARRTGGLADTVRDIDERPDDANGFLFDHADAESLRAACGRALELFRNDATRLALLQRLGMREDFSWRLAALSYRRALERAALKERRRVLP